jgi:hypothetical protein
VSSMQYGPGGASIAIPTGAPLTFEQQQAKILENPFYKQQTQWLNDDVALKKQRAAEDAALAKQFYDLNVQQASAGASSGGDYGLAAATAQAALAKENAARDNANRAEYLREALASRGMASSGQNVWEQNQRDFEYQQGLKGIDIDLKARADAAAQARAEAQSRLSMQLQEMQLRYQADVRDQGRYLSDLDSGAARERGNILMSEWDRLWKTGAFDTPSMMAAFDPASGLYRSSDGRWWKGLDANGNPIPADAPGSGGGGGGGGGGGSIPEYVPGSGQITAYPESRPAENYTGSYGGLPGWGYE